MESWGSTANKDLSDYGSDSILVTFNKGQSDDSVSDLVIQLPRIRQPVG